MSFIELFRAKIQIFKISIKLLYDITFEAKQNKPKQKKQISISTVNLIVFRKKSE